MTPASYGCLHACTDLEGQRESGYLHLPYLLLTENVIMAHTRIHAGKRILEAVRQLGYASLLHVLYGFVRRELKRGFSAQ